MSNSTFFFLGRNLRPSLLGFYFFIPISVIAIPLSYASQGLPASIQRLAFIGILITLTTFAFYFAIFKALANLKLSNLFVSTVILLVATGVIRGFLFYWFIEFFELPNPTPLFGRILNSTFTTVFWIGLASLFIESNDRFARRYRAILTQILLLRLRENAQSEPGYAYMAKQITSLQLKIKNTLLETRKMGSKQNPELLIANALRKEIEEELKPLSQRLWVKSVFEPPNFRFWELLKTSIFELKYPFQLTALLYSAANFINVAQIIGSSIAILFGISSYGLFYLAESVRLKTCNSFSSNKGKLNAAFVVVLGFFIGLGNSLIFDFLGLAHSYSVALITAPSLSILLIATSLIKLAAADRSSLIEILSRRARDEDYDYLEKISRGNAASYIHNSLQSELTALALQLDALADNPDSFQNKIVMERLESLVNRSISEDFNSFLETPQLRLQRIIESWDGIAAIDLNIDPRVFSDSSRAALVVQLVQESVANAVRSGGASKISITGEIKNESIVITARDNGLNNEVNGNTGIGSKWLDSIAVTNWSLEVSEHGHLLSVEI